MGRSRVLLIDDNESFRRMVSRTLVNAGYDVTEASDGRSGLAAFRQQPCDVVVTDIIMPDVEGLQTIQELRREDPTVKIIAMSGAGATRGVGYLDLASRFGARHILQKPFKQEQLLAALAEVLAT